MADNFKHNILFTMGNLMSYFFADSKNESQKIEIELLEKGTILKLITSYDSPFEETNDTITIKINNLMGYEDIKEIIGKKYLKSHRTCILDIFDCEDYMKQNLKFKYIIFLNKNCQILLKIENIDIEDINFDDNIDQRVFIDIDSLAEYYRNVGQKLEQEINKKMCA